ncbi:hypothetical protein LTS18_007317 [Coniosporium uncinatum]|uniref:Uncharacterized protein n=1 Tax=Coniosporium uncinatum TaxID=93489 RepID=A0ACC3D374_9PEZI|nr:hypothetical protein LTS18_007317 [Coniosporium uncinatum]
MAPSSAQVLTTPELLKMILLFLPLGDTLVVQRVCKYWHALLASSPAFHKELVVNTRTRALKLRMCEPCCDSTIHGCLPNMQLTRELDISIGTPHCTFPAADGPPSLQRGNISHSSGHNLRTSKDL